MKTLKEINDRGNGRFFSDKGTIHSYLPYYDALLTPYRDKNINLFECGYQHGGSCKLWLEYFPKAIIKSIDVDNTCLDIGDERSSIDIKSIKDITPEYFKDFIPDVAIDDGSHSLEDQIIFIKLVYPLLASGGIMIVEDIQDINNQKSFFDALDIPYELVDNRTKHQRYDEVFLIYRKP